MGVLYNIGSMDIFRNLRILLLVISLIMSLTAILKLKKIISNYNYINREISMLENLSNLSDVEFISWVEEYLVSKGYYNLKHLEDEFYIVNDGVKNNLVFIDRKYNILDKVEAKYIAGYSYTNNFDAVIIITMGEIDTSFYKILNNKNLLHKSFSKEDFKRGYKEFIVGDF
ncbi:MAG: hypothetical protein ACRCTZ_10760 [Sarcina sp.]